MPEWTLLVSGRQISRELRDNLSQKVAVLAISISNARRHLACHWHVADASLSELDGLLRQTTELADAIQDLSHRLHSAVLEYSGLVAGLKSFVDEFSRLEGMDIAITTAGRPRAPRSSRAELLSNRAEHLMRRRSSSRCAEYHARDHERPLESRWYSALFSGNALSPARWS